VPWAKATPSTRPPISSQDWKITNFVLNAGDSTILALGKPSGKDAWNPSPSATVPNQLATHEPRRQRLRLRRQRRAHHEPAPLPARARIKNRRTYALAPTAALSDALSTAFMIMDPSRRDRPAGRAARTRPASVWHASRPTDANPSSSESCGRSLPTGAAAAVHHHRGGAHGAGRRPALAGRAW
jgi:hypothetical protein